MADLGFTDFERLQSYADKGIYFINRVPVNARIYLPEHPKGIPLAELLKQRQNGGEELIDVDATLGNKGCVTGRFIALACPADVSRRGYGSWRRTPSGGTVDRRATA